MSSAPSAKSSINPSEIAHFQKDSLHWWDEDGAFAPLHRMNPHRILYIKQQIMAHFDCDSLQDINILDVGCGGGLVSEPLSRLGANTLGIDADEQAIAVATNHAEQTGASARYQQTSVEDVTDTYDVVLALEIVEHVNDPQAFIQACASRVKPGGILILSTLNRTTKSFLGGIVAAEYLLRWVPQGTHDWKKFLKPSELARMVRDCDLTEKDVSGINFNPISGEFSLHSSKICVNYLLSATKPIR